MRKTIEWGKNSYRTLIEHRYTTVAGTLVFFFVMSLVPLTFFLTLILGKLHLNTDAILNMELFGWAKDLLLFFRENAEGTKAGVFFLITTLWSGSSFFFHLRRSGEIIYNYRRQKQGWRVRISALALTLLLLLFFVVCAILLVGSIWISRPLPRWLSYLVVYSVVLVIGFFSAWFLNCYLCPYLVKFRDMVWGSALTAGLWLLASIAFSIYLSLSDKTKLYGALAVVIVFLLWLYWMMICLTVGVIYNCRRIELRGLKHKKY